MNTMLNRMQVKLHLFTQDQHSHSQRAWTYLSGTFLEQTDRHSFNGYLPVQPG